MPEDQKSFCFAKASPQVAKELAEMIEADVRYSQSVGYLESLSKYLLTMTPDNQLHDDEAAIDKKTAHLLFTFNTLNWWKDSCPKFHPIVFDKGGSVKSLCNAASISVWGILDSALMKVLRKTLEDDYMNDKVLYIRWLQTKQNRESNGEVTEEWHALMESLINPRRSATGIHIFALANILRRVIIMMSDNQLSGLYLPLLWSPDDCYKSPLLIGYQGGFAPLIPDLPKGSNGTIPLVNGNLTPLVVRYLRNMEIEHTDELIRKYLDIVELDVTSKFGKEETVKACKMNLCKIDKKLNMIERYTDAKKNKLIEAETSVLSIRWGQIGIGFSPPDWYEDIQDAVYKYLTRPENDISEGIQSAGEGYTSLHIAADEGAKARNFFGRATAFLTNDKEKGTDGLSTALGKRSILKRQYSLSDMAPKLGLFGERSSNSSMDDRKSSARIMRQKWITGARSAKAYDQNSMSIAEECGQPPAVPNLQPVRKFSFPNPKAKANTGGRIGFTIHKSITRVQRKKSAEAISEI